MEGLVTSDAPLNFDDFFIDQHERLFRALYFVTGSRQDAEELMQDAFLKLWERWDRIGEIDDAEGYLYRVALNGFRMRARRAKVAAKHLMVAGTAPDPSPTWTSNRTSTDCCSNSHRGSEPPWSSRRCTGTARNRPAR